MALGSRSAAPVALACLAFAAPAGAGAPGHWTDLNQADSNTARVTAARGPSGVLNILWARDADHAVVNTQISANGKNVLGNHTVFTYGSSVGPTALVGSAGGLQAFFAGLFPSDPHDVGLSTATSPDGVSWSVQPTLASDGRSGRRSSVYVAAGLAATLFANGTPLSVWGDSAPNQHGYHVGTSDQTPDVRYGSGGAGVDGPGAATDGATGQVAVGYSDLDAERTQVRVVQPMFDPTDQDPWFPPGPVMNTPGGQAPDGSQPTQMTGRSGGAAGIFVSYLRGDNMFTSRPAVWRIGAGQPIGGLPGARGARYMGVTMGPGGRIWAFWARSSGGWRIFGARSNKDATRFGQAVAIKPPGGDAATVFALEAEGTGPGGMLDVIALVQRTSSDIDNFHQRMRPGITLLAKVLGGGKVRFTTLDAGAALAAKIAYGGNTATTGPDGVVEMPGKVGKHQVTATRTGYQPQSRRVKVK